MKIYLSAGHGGQDSGAVGINGRKEKDETLKITLAVCALLKSAGHQVIMARETDKLVPVREIAALANDCRADLFVAIHLNASNGAGHGTECLVCSAASKTAKKLAEQINARLGAMGFRNRGVKVQDTNTYVLKATKMPATTVEVCFIDNAGDMELYDKNSNEIPKLIAHGILAIAGGQIAEVEVTNDDDKWRWRVDEIKLLKAPHDNAEVIKTLTVGEEVILESYFTGDKYARVRADGTVGYIDFDLIKK